jgi:hypothetical protein
MQTPRVKHGLVSGHGVVGEGNATLVVFESFGRNGEWTTKSGKELSEE